MCVRVCGLASLFTGLSTYRGLFYAKAIRNEGQ